MPIANGRKVPGSGDPITGHFGDAHVVETDIVEDVGGEENIL
jgi:hypothetical protein